jgi:hypothetical protein
MGNKVTQITVSGHAIESCKSNFTRDVCVVCSAGYVQPDVISSTADPNTTSCFKPTSPPGSDFMVVKILDMYNVLIGHGIPGNGKVFRDLKT